MHITRTLRRTLILTAAATTAAAGLAAPSAPASAATINYSNLGTFQTPALDIGGVTVTGSADVNVLNLNGLGIVGGFFDHSVEHEEVISFTFNDDPAEDVAVTLSARIVGGILEADVTGYDADGLSLGTVSTSLFTSPGGDISARFGGVPLSRFDIELTQPDSSSSNGDLLRVFSLSFTPVPEPASAALLGATAGVLAFRRRRA
jgi:hypothetical protein